MIPDSVQIIEEGAFTRNALQSVQLGSGFASIEGDAFSKNEIANATVLPNSLTSLGRRVSHLGGGAFNGNQITNINFWEGLTFIGYWSFQGTNLTISGRQ